MRVLIDDGMQIQVGTGIGKYTLYLYNELKNALTSDNAVDLEQFDKRDSSKKQGRLKYLRHINSIDYYKKCGNYDVVHFTNYAMPFIKNPRTKYIVTIHDLASFTHPESLSTAYKLYNRFIVTHAIKNADVILTVSKAIKDEIGRKWPEYAGKIRVAYPGLYSEFNPGSIQRQYDSEVLSYIQKDKFFLFVGTVEKRKNLGIVLQAFINMKRQDRSNQYKLVLAGRAGYGYEEYEQIISNSEFRDDIIVTGYLSSADVNKLYSEAAAYVFPSVYEGFGSTQLECMVNHLPLILSDIPTNLEVSKEYGMFFSLDNIDELQMRMEQIVRCDYDYVSKNKMADLICEEYSWKNLISTYIEAYL